MTERFPASPGAGSSDIPSQDVTELSQLTSSVLSKAVKQGTSRADSTSSPSLTPLMSHTRPSDTCTVLGVRPPTTHTNLSAILTAPDQLRALGVTDQGDPCRGFLTADSASSTSSLVNITAADVRHANTPATCLSSSSSSSSSSEGAPNDSKS